jgi:hypothetical protein
MTVSDEELDRKRANTLMELLPPVGWSDVARRSDIAELRGEMAGLRAELKGEMAELRADVRSALADFRTQIMTTVIGSMIGVAVLVLAAVAIA